MRLDNDTFISLWGTIDLGYSFLSHAMLVASPQPSPAAIPKTYPLCIYLADKIQRPGCDARIVYLVQFQFKVPRPSLYTTSLWTTTYNWIKWHQIPLGHRCRAKMILKLVNKDMRELTGLQDVERWNLPYCFVNCTNTVRTLISICITDIVYTWDDRYHILNAQSWVYESLMWVQTSMNLNMLMLISLQGRRGIEKRKGGVYTPNIRIFPEWKVSLLSYFVLCLATWWHHRQLIMWR